MGRPARIPRAAATTRGQRGFTLLELLVTLGVSVIGMTGIMALHLATVRTNASSSQAAEAVTVAAGTLEEARGLGLDQMFVEYEDDGELPIDWDYGAQTVVGRTTTYLRRIIVENVSSSDDLLRVRVEVSWAEDGADVNDPDQRRMVSLEVLRTRQETL